MKPPRPFQIDPRVVDGIRCMERKDLRRVAQLHRAAMGNSLWAQLGAPFLRELYRGMLGSPHFIGFVYQQDGHIEGFIAGSEDADAMMREIARSHWPRLGFTASVGLLSSPTLARKLLETSRYFKRSGEGVEHIPAESLFCSFTPRTRGRRISGHINKALFDTLLHRGHNKVKITTETSNKGANRQLQSWGFSPALNFQFYGKEMVTYTLELGSSPRLSPKDWARE
jgi:hypothetical protein